MLSLCVCVKLLCVTFGYVKLLYVKFVYVGLCLLSYCIEFVYVKLLYVKFFFVCVKHLNRCKTSNSAVTPGLYIFCTKTQGGNLVSIAGCQRRGLCHD